MTLKERIKTLANERGISLPALEAELGFGNSTIVKWDKSVPNAEKLNSVAQYFGVSMEYLLNGDDHVCPQCGFRFTFRDDEEIADHKEEHILWEKANEKYGTLYCNPIENERLKAQGRNASYNLDLPLEDRYNAQLITLRCLFSRSVQANGYSLKHISFEKYVAMMLNNEKYRSRLDIELRQKLIDDFGTLPGIKNGESIYYIPTTAVAHKNQENFSSNEDLIKKYRALDDHGREMVDFTLEKEYERSIAFQDRNNVISYQIKEPEPDYLMVNAAHALDGASEEDKQFDDDIMDDENF